MHWYKKNIGDYSKKAGPLTMIQHGAYTLLLDSCYDREEFPTEAQALDWTWASTEEEIAAVKFVLRKFFKDDGGIFVQNRIREELAEYHEKAIKNKQIAEEREARRKEAATNRARTVHEAPPNQEPITNNQEPITSNQFVIAQGKELETAGAKAPAKAKGARLSPSWKLPKAWGDWAMERGMDRKRVVTEAERFGNYWIAKAGRDAAKLDWEATWRNWIIKSMETQGGVRTGGDKPGGFIDRHTDKSWAEGL